MKRSAEKVDLVQPDRDYQVGGDHYTKRDIQPWDAMGSWMLPLEFQGYLRGNVIKYVGRFRDKDGLKDLKKALHYLQKLIHEVEHESD